MKILIAVVTCHRLRHRADAQRNTWLPLVRGADVRFFVGAGGQKSRSDEVMLDVPGDYLSLPYKSRAVFRWALEHGYDWVFKTDDDCYIQPSRLLKSEFEFHHYTGKLSEGAKLIPYASGFAYWVSRQAMELLSTAKIDDTAEDRWTGTTLSNAGIVLHHDNRYVITNSLKPRNHLSGSEGPQMGNDVIVAAEYNPEMMRRIHSEWLRSCKDSASTTAAGMPPP